jgi:ribosomal protein S18 acetylase RimI-like enzyme
MGLFDQPQATAPAAKPASDWDEKKHPRWDAGDKQHHGGQFSPKQAEESAEKTAPFDFAAIVKEARAKGQNIHAAAREAGVPSTHENKRALMKAANDLPPEEPKVGPGQARGQAKFNEARAKEERPAEPDPASESKGSGEPAAPATAGERVAAAIAKKSMDFGRKVEVRKDRAKKLGPRAKTEEPVEQVEGWAKRYAIARIDYSRDKSEEGKYAIYDTRTKSRWNAMGHRQATSKLFDSEAEAKAALPLLEVARNHGVYRSQDGNSYEIRRKFDRHSALVKGGFGSRDEAELHMATNPREVINHKFPSYETYQYLTEVKREGPERRKGEVNERDFREAFNPGGAVFGNWMSNKDGVAAFHHAHDSLHDLADVLEIHPQQVSLDGDLVYGFGAAGSGGKNAARAHYEPAQRLINLTKMSGAGSLAHEWWHALDHFIAKHHGLDGHTAVGRKARHMTGDEGLKKAVTDLHHALHNTAEDRVIEAHDKVQDEKEAKRLQFRAEARQKAIEDNHRIPYAESVQDYLHNIKFDRDRTAEWKKKKVKPELLKEFDELEAKIAAGDHGEEVYVPSKSKWGLGTTTYANLKALDDVHKKITGRSFLVRDNGNDIYHQFKIDKAKAQEKAARTARAGQTERVFRPSTFSREAAELDRSRASSYYTLPEEMGARAFEAYIADKLNEKGIRSDYLIGKGKTNNAVYRAFGLPGPFPEGEERKQINEAFDKLLTEVRKHLRKPEREKHSLADEARELSERASRLIERYSEAGELQPGLKGQQDNHPHWETPEFKSWFGQSKAVQPTGKPLRVFHGSKRPDRIGSEFKANRATSGPMSFFTDDPDIASSYATGKQDTSLQMPGSYAGWFKYKPQGSRGHVSLDHAWYHLPQEQRQAALERLPHVNQDEDGNISHKHGQGTVVGDWDWYLKREGQGNPIKAARAIWLDSGALFNDEHRFLEVLKHAGIDTSNFHYESPWHEQPGVHAAWLSIQNPLDTANIPDQVHDALHAAGRLKRGKTGSGADQWDKRHVSGRDWLQRLAEDKQNGTAHAWTSIPDWATKTLKSLGYDGIKDMGGKYGGPKHSVWIPFGPHQIKSAMGNRGTFNSSSKKITYGAGGLVERYSAGHGFEELLARAAKYTQKGQGYNRNIHASANRVESMLAEGRHKEAAHWADELKLRLDGLEPKPSAEPAKQNSLLDSQGQGLLFSRTGQTQRGLFGDDYEAKPLGKQESDLPKPPEPIKQHKPKPGQQSLFSAVADAMGVSVERYGSTIRHGKYSVTKGDDGLWYHFLHGKNGLQYASLVGFNSVKEAMRDAVKRVKPPAMRQVAEGPAKGNWEIVPNQPEDKGLPSQPSSSAGKPQEPQDKSMFSAVASALGASVERYQNSIEEWTKQTEAEHPEAANLFASERDNAIHLHNIEINKANRGKGIGSQIVAKLQAYAQKKQKPITLEAVPEPGKKGALNRFYKSVGFQKPGRRRDYSLPAGHTHIWRPETENHSVGESVERYAVKGLMAGAAGPAQARPKVTKIASHADLPPIPEGMTRATHFFQDANLAQQFNTGSHFKYGRGLLSSTTDGFSSNEHVHGLMKTGMNGAFDRKSFGNFVAVMDIPHQEYKSRGRMHAETPEIHNSKITGYYNRESGEFHHNPGYNPSLIKQNIGPVPSKNLTNRPLPLPFSSQPAPQLNDEKASSSSPAIDVWSASYHSSVERYAAKQAASPWFLKSRELLKQKMGQHAPASQVLAMLKNNQISPEELEWTGLENHLRSKGNSPVSQQELHDLIGKFRIEEKVLGRAHLFEKYKKKGFSAKEHSHYGWLILNQHGEGVGSTKNGKTPDEALKDWTTHVGGKQDEIPKHENWSVPGGENYQEMLLKLPESKTGIEDWYKTVFVPEAKEENPGYEPPSTFAGYDANAKEGLAEMYQRWAKGKGSGGYLSRHWDDPNVLAHIRYKDYVGPDGKKHLHIDEIQSDWHQAGRKQGYGHADKTAGLSREEMGRQYEEHVGYNPIEDDPGMSDDELRQLLQGHYEEAGSAHVPNAPFKKNWHMLAMKRMLHHAAANGYDRVSWTPGAEHADRYRLDKHLDSIHYFPSTGELFANSKRKNDTVLTGEVKDGKFHSAYHPEMHGKHLHEIFGHDIADKIQNSKWPWSGGEHHDYKVVLKGDDLKIGHSGMRKFYDQMLPADTNKLIKRHGGKVGQFDLHLPDYSDGGGFETKPAQVMKVHGFDITPSMKAEAASGKGQSMFSVYEEPGLHIERYEQETPGLQPRFRIGAGEQRLSEQFVKIPSTKPPAIFGILGKAAGMVGKAAVGMKGVAAKAGDKMLGAIQPSADKLAGKIGGATESLDRKGQAAMSKVGLATKPQQTPVKPVTQGVKAGAPVMLSQPHDIHGNGRQLIPQGTQGKYIGPHSEPGHAVVEVNGIQHIIPTKSLTYSAQHTDHKAIEKHKQNQVEQAKKQKSLTARQRAEAVPEGVDSTPQEQGLVSSHELQAGDIIEHRTPGLPPRGRVVEVNPKTHEVTIDLALRSPGSPDGIATVGRRMTIPGYDKLAKNGGTVSKQFETSRVPDEARPIGQRKEYQEMLAGAKAIGLNDDAAHEMAMQAWDQSQAKLNPNPKSAPAQVQNAPARPAAQAAAQPKPRHHVSSLQVGDTIRLLSGPESQVNLRYLGPGSRKGFVTVDHPQRGKQEIPVKSAGLRVPGKAKAAKPEQVSAPQEQGSNPDRPRNHVSNLQKGDVLRHLSGDQKGQNVRFVRRSDKPGQVIVNTPEKGDHELPATSLGLYSQASLSWYTKAHARNILGQNESMEPRDAIRLARLARGNRRAPQPHQVPRSEFAQYQHGMLAKDKQGNGFLLYGGNRYPLTSAEFDGNKLIGDPVKIRERIHLEQIKAIASKDPAAVPSRVRAEYEHQWPKFTGSSAFAKSGGVQPQRSSRKNQPNAGQLNLLPGPSILQPSMEAGRRAQKIINARGVEDEREIDTEIDPNRPQAQIDRREAANRAFMEASAARFNENRPAGGPAVSQPPNQPAAAAPAPPSVSSPAQEEKTPLWQLTRPFKMGRNEVNVQFDSAKQRDLHDYAASVANARSFSGKAGRGRPNSAQQQQAKLKAIADAHFGGNMDAAHQEALQVRAHVKSHMAGAKDGEHRVIPPLGVEAAKQETPAAQPKQKLQASIGKAIVEARNSDAGGKHRIEHEILRSMPVEAEAFHPEVLPQVVQMIKDHIGEFHAPRRMEAEKLANAWQNARVKMGVGRDERKADARKKLEQLRNGEIDAGSKQLKHMDLIGDHLRKHFPNRFSEDEGDRNMQVVEFLAGDRPRIPQPHDSDLIEKFWKSLEPGYEAWLAEVANGAPFNREEWGGLHSHMPPPDDWEVNDFNHFSASGDSIAERFSAVWSAGVTREKIKDSAAATATSAGIPSRQVQA